MLSCSRLRNGTYHLKHYGPLQFQRRYLLDAILLKTLGTSLMSRIAVEYAYSRYLGILRYFAAVIRGERVHHPEISHQAIPLIRRSKNELITLDDSIYKLKNQYNTLQYLHNINNSNNKYFHHQYVYTKDIDDNDDNIALILNIGQKKSAKSFNATLLSILLSSDGGCYFPVSNETDSQTTFGIDISPPLSICTPLPDNNMILKDIGYIKYISFVDIEGINNINDDIIEIIKNNILGKCPCIIILSSMYCFDENDIYLLEKLCNDNKNPLILALVSNIDKVELSSNYLKIINDININSKLCLLPFFDSVSHRTRKSLHNLPYNTPFKYMKHTEKVCYYKLCREVIGMMAESNKSGNCLGISSKTMIDMLDNIASSSISQKTEKKKEKHFHTHSQKK
eukprot:437079_1